MLSKTLSLVGRGSPHRAAREGDGGVASRLNAGRVVRPATWLVDVQTDALERRWMTAFFLLLYGWMFVILNKRNCFL